MLLRALYHAVAELRDAHFPEREPLPRFTPLGTDYLNDVMAADALGDGRLTL